MINPLVRLTRSRNTSESFLLGRSIPTVIISLILPGLAVIMTIRSVRRDGKSQTGKAESDLSAHSVSLHAEPGSHSDREIEESLTSIQNHCLARQPIGGSGAKEDHRPHQIIRLADFSQWDTLNVIIVKIFVLQSFSVSGRSLSFRGLSH